MAAQEQLSESTPTVEGRAFVSAPTRQHQADTLGFGERANRVLRMIWSKRCHLVVVHRFVRRWQSGRWADRRPIDVALLFKDGFDKFALIFEGNVVALPVEKRIGVQYTTIFAK